MIMTFKKIVELLGHIETEKDVFHAWAVIDRSYEHEKITWKDHEMLYDLASKIYTAYGYDKKQEETC